MNRTQWLAFYSAALLSTSLCASEQTEWRSLFNGRNLDGWTVKCKPQDRSTSFWKVEDGAIVADSMGNSSHDYVWLVSTAEYTNFVLQLEFLAFHGNSGNSGVQVRSRYDDAAGWLDGPQIDIHPPGPWRTGMIWDETRGNQRWLFPPVPKGQWVNESMAQPGLRFHYADQSDQDIGWNKLQIEAQGLRLKVSLNGLKVTDYDGVEVLDDPVHQQRRVGKSGHIALQIHTKDQLRIRYKAIRLKSL